MAELKNALRSGDVSVSGSRQFRAFEEYLMPHATFDADLRACRPLSRVDSQCRESPTGFPLWAKK
jgi:hypothetical protein